MACRESRRVDLLKTLPRIKKRDSTLPKALRLSPLGLLIRGSTNG
jgi:hypothetical protein